MSVPVLCHVAYTPSAIAPVVAAALAGALVAQGFGVRPCLIDAAAIGVETHHYLTHAGLGVICALLGIALMRTVAMVERRGGRHARVGA